jgi:hypothetical protein
MALLIAGSLFATAACAESRDVQFVAGLQQRRLFELAEAYCQQRLQAAGKDETAAAELTVELLRTYTLHALHQPAAERAPWFAKAHALAGDFTRMPRPRGVLVQLQDALSLLAEGELAAAEYRAGVIPESSLELALAPLRKASTALDALDKQLTREIPLVRRRSLAPGELTADELFSLQQHVLVQWAKACRLRGELYADKTPDRVALTQQALEILKTPLAQLAPEDPLADQVRLELATCERLLGNTREAGEFLALLDQAPKSPATRLKARAERIRTALAARDSAAVMSLLNLGRVLAGENSAELDLAWLEAYIDQWKQVSQQQKTAEVQAWQEKAAELARFIQDTHGAYWGRRADQLLVHALGGNASGAGAAVLARTADNFYRQGDLDQAAATYEKAADQALAAGDAALALELASKGALVQQNRQEHVDAARRFRTAALRDPAQPQASAAHLQGAWNLAQQVRRDPQSAEAYVAALHEHLQTWPTATSTAQAALWLGQWQTARQQWREALAAYAQVPLDSPKLDEAIPAAGKAARHWLSTSVASGKSVSSDLITALSFFQRVLFSEGGRLPERWTQTQRDAALAIAELRLAYEPGSAGEVEPLLTAALQSAQDLPAAWQQEATLQRILALAALPGRERDAQAAIAQVAAASPDQLLASIDRMSQVAASSPPNMRGAIAGLQLQTIGLLEQKRAQLPAAELVTLDRIKAEALVSAGKQAEAFAIYARLVKENPNHGPIQEGWGDMLLAATDKGSLEQARDQWRRIAARSKPRTSRWCKAKYNVALALFKLGDKPGAAELLRYTLEVPPGLADTGWETQFQNLLRQVEP